MNEDENEYIKIINYWPGIYPIIKAMSNISHKNQSFEETGIVIKDKDDKTYSYEYNSESNVYVSDAFFKPGREIVINCSDNRQLTIGIAEQRIIKSNYSFDSITYVAIKYKLGENNILFSTNFTKDHQDNEDFFKNVNCQVKYKKKVFRGSLLTYYHKTIKYGKKEEAKKILNLHNEITDRLIKNVFTIDELRMIYTKLLAVYIKDFEEERDRIFIALTNHNKGIQR